MSGITHDELMDRIAPMLAAGPTPPRPALDAVNAPMIRHWVEAIGDPDPRFAGPDAVAPPAMAQVWTMYGPDPLRPDADPLHGTMRILDEAGFTSVLGTDCDQTYARFLTQGERTAITSRLVSVVGPKQTGVGIGYFVTTENTWWVEGVDGQSEAVATMTFRVLKFKPGTGSSAASGIDRRRIVRPVRNRDNDYFFEGTTLGEVRIQTCNACGALRHPPGPVCPICHATDRGHVVASGLGTVFSEITHHAPQIPGRELPLRIVLVDLDEGVRMVGVYLGAEAPEIGARVRAAFDRIDDDLTLVGWGPADVEIGVVPGRDRTSTTSTSESVPPALPPWRLPVTPTLIVSTALATRDFQDVHHDRDLAQKRGSKDIFLNILSTTGLVQRFVGEWARARFGEDVRITACALRLGAPAHPYDTLTFTGDLVSDNGREVVIDVVGGVSLGTHVNARVTLIRGET